MAEIASAAGEVALLLPSDLVRLLTGPCVAHFGTVQGGRPHVTPVWIEPAANGHDLEVDIAASTQKAVNIRRCPAVSISLTDPACSSTWYVIEGHVVATALLTTDHNIQRLAVRNLGRRRQNPELPRLLVTVRPARILCETGAQPRPGQA